MEGGLGLHLQSAVRWRDESKHRLGYYGRREEKKGMRNKKGTV